MCKACSTVVSCLKNLSKFPMDRLRGVVVGVVDPWIVDGILKM